MDPYFNLQRQNAIRYSESDSDVRLPAVLDLCCGRGGGIWFISQNYSLGQSMGVDISKFMIDYARKNPSANLDFIRGDVEDLASNRQLQMELEKQAFDIILCIEGVHCLQSPRKFLHEVHQLMEVCRDNDNSSLAPYFIIADLFDTQDLD